jgi:medium-chain acyl-[acyl-carrier-protein] hydrolase
MQLKKVWFEETQVKSSETDFRMRWKISSFFEAMQEAAAHHASHLGFGYTDLLAQDMVWILSRVKIKFHDFPLHEEKVTIQTWPKTIQQRLFFLRDFLLFGSDGRKCASASSAYVLVNPSARRVLPAQALKSEMPDNEGLVAIDETLEKIPAGEPLEEYMCVEARYSAVDLIGHVNNARYIDWVSDCFSFEEHQSRKLDWLQINYINEVKPGESVRLARAKYPDAAGGWYITGTNLKTSQKSFEAALQWSAD